MYLCTLAAQEEAKQERDTCNAALEQLRVARSDNDILKYVARWKY